MFSEEQLRDSNLLAAAVNHNQHKDHHPSVASLGLKRQQIRHGNLEAPGLPRISEEFLIASRMRRWDHETTLSVNEYFTDRIAFVRSQLDAEPDAEAPRLPLPGDVVIQAPLSDVARRRRSIRHFSAASVPLEDTAAVLRHCGGVSGQTLTKLDGGGSLSTEVRVTASGGGLYPVELWIAALRVTGVDVGIYRYLPREDALVRWAGDAAVRLLRASFTEGGEAEIDRAAFVLLFVARPWRSMRKYGPRGMRFVLHETGAMAQNASLASAGLGLGSVDYSSFYDDEANEALGIDGLFQTLLHTLVVGVPDNDGNPSGIKEDLSQWSPAPFRAFAGISQSSATT